MHQIPALIAIMLSGPLARFKSDDALCALVEHSASLLVQVQFPVMTKAHVKDI